MKRTSVSSSAVLGLAFPGQVTAEEIGVGTSTGREPQDEDLPAEDKTVSAQNNTNQAKQDLTPDVVAPIRPEVASAFSSPGVIGGIDPSRFRLDQAFDAQVTKLITTVPTRKPHKQEFVRAHPSLEYRLEANLLVSVEDRETYLVEPQVRAMLLGDLVPMILITTINTAGVVSLWPIRLPGSDGRVDTFNASALEAAGIAEKSWIRVVANMSLKGYDVYAAAGNIPEPQWPNLSFAEILTIAFKGKIIDSIEHPVVRRLRGEL